MALSNVRLDSATGMVMRAGRRVGLAALVLFLGCDGLQTAAANGDTRTLTFHHTHTGESLTVTYRRDGRYDDEALKKINWVMRDWRRNKAVRMDPAVIDAVWELTRSVDASDVDIICGYRAPETNSMLRSRSGGVAKASQHMLGKAIDLKVRGVSLEKQRAAAMRLHRGGVGYYPGSQFIHVDTASIRHWPRMTYDQLARVFPDGRTVHVPSNGKPLPGYQLALADLQKRGSSTAVASAEAGSLLKPGKNLLASLFGGARDAEEDEDATRAPAASPSASAKPAASPRQTRVQTAQAEIARPDLRPDLKPEPKPEAKPAVARVEVARPAAARVAARPAAAPAAAPEPAGPEMFALASASSTPVRLASAGDMPVESTAVAVLGAAPPRPPAELGSTDIAPTAAIGPQPVRTASVDPMAPVGRDRTPSRTGSLWSRDHDAADRVPLELALAYATEPDRRAAAAPPARAPAMGSLVDRARLSADAAVAAPAPAPATASAADAPLTVVKKIAARVPSGRAGEAAAAPRSAPAAVVPVTAGMRFDDPWLRAVMLTPSLHAAMTVTSYGDPDYAELRSLMGKPTGSVVMAFGSDPYPGLVSNRFSGGAVVFVSTVRFRTAALH